MVEVEQWAEIRRMHSVLGVSIRETARRTGRDRNGFLAGRSPRNKGLRYPANPPKVEEIIAVMRAARDASGRRLRGLIVILWRAGLRIQEALAP